MPSAAALSSVSTASSMSSVVSDEIACSKSSSPYCAVLIHLNLHRMVSNCISLDGEPHRLLQNSNYSGVIASESAKDTQ